TLGRPAFAITCGGYRLIDLLKSSFDAPILAAVRPYLAAIQAADWPDTLLNLARSDRPTLFVNARLAPTIRAMTHLQSLTRQTGDQVIVDRDELVACWIQDPSRYFDSAGSLVQNLLLASNSDTVGTQATQTDTTADELPLQLFSYPHDLIRLHMANISENLEHRAVVGSYQQTADGVYAAAGVQCSSHTVFDTRKGPIILDEDCQIGPFSYLRGPVYVGRGARVTEHASLKDGVCLGHTTKVGGEIECSILEPYSNKQHHGFLGHSWLGSWINLGAGTSNSDLKNTYGTVNMRYGQEKVPTGMQFVGCFVGDYAKTAINTSIFTGKTIGVGSMVYGFATSNVPSFVNYAPSLGHLTEMSLSAMVATQARMFARRNVPQRPCDIALLESMYELTRADRSELGELPSEPIAW
ncbi:MAG: putative sugar nucleotidyl transferase, partial [Planctomycetota bacterium]|nr:putative sugar nucleotidyl transferase [Planctomycetota bacterium]